MTRTIQLLIISKVVLLLFVKESASIHFNKTSIESQPLNIREEFTLTFRTCEGGVLLHQAGNSNDFFELAVVAGFMNYTSGIFSHSSLKLTWNLSGSSSYMVLNVGSELDQNKPYQVIFSPGTKNATLSVSLGSKIESIGVPGSVFNVGAKKLELGQGFVGCIRFGDMFKLVNEKSNDCQLDSGTRCSRGECPDGYKGYYCEINIDDCASSPCHHASTCIDKIANYSCSCGPAWYGRNCDKLRNQTFCDDNPCENGGICRPVSHFNNYTCTCPPQFIGQNCTEVVNPCANMPCQNNATCGNIKNIDFHCTCPKGYAGRHCEINIDDCAKADCGHGKCIDGIEQHTCNCTNSGYTGSDCKQDIDECIMFKPCMNNALCTNYVGGYLCMCVGDYKGKNCEEKIDDCASKPCENGGNCTDLVKDFKCNCPRGFAGDRCEIKLHACNVIGCTACEEMPCHHGNCSCTCTDDTMYYNCSCEQGYSGTSCEVDINECENEPRICGHNGTCRNTNGSFFCKCDEGFTGTYCNETTGPCNPSPCKNGACKSVNVTDDLGNVTESYSCSCSDGWQGRNCTEDVDECFTITDLCNKSTSDCMNTIGSYRCECHPGYGGEQCTDINECQTLRSPCNMQGLCKNNEGSYECFCSNGFTGLTCLENINDCIDSSGDPRCKNGRCIDGVSEFTCDCFPGWNGTHCDVDIDECKLGYCRNNGTCNNTQGSYSCTCLPGFTDMNCSTDIDECMTSPAPCNSQGTCMDRVNGYECDCRQGYEGEFCEVDVDWCSETRNNGLLPCDYGTCKDGILNYTCSCFEGFTGENCSIDEDECISMPCENSGFCVQKSNVTAVMHYFEVNRVYPKNESGGYLCVCAPGYNGTNCENNIDECLLYQACNDTGTESCEDGVNNYTCNCNKGYTGRNCSEDVDECSESPCRNNATCQNLIGQYNCICDSNYTGVNCESLVDPCTAMNPCRNGATCLVTSEFNYTCLCAEGFAGQRCTDRTTLGFDGSSSMTLSIPQTTANISLSFQTISPNGVLITESGKWSLSFVAGKLGLVCEGTRECELGESGMFTDLSWHKVEILVNGSYVTAKAFEGERILPCSSSCNPSRARRALAAETQLIVGADSGDSSESNFVGSVRDFSVNNVKYYPGIPGVVAEGVAPGFQRQNVCSPDPCGVNGVCQDLWTRYLCECNRHWTSTNCTESVLWGTFGTVNQLVNGYRAAANRSYASYSISTIFNSLAFTIRTRSNSSLVIQLNYKDSLALSVETDGNGFLRLRDRNGFIESNGNLKISSGVLHYIYINRTTVQVDNETYGVILTSFPVREVFIGGTPEVSANAQFRGCLRDVRLDGQQLLFFNQTSLNSSQLNIAQGCFGEDVCGEISGSNPCLNGGNCSDLWNEHQCACRSPYGGINCVLYGCEWMNPCPNNSTCVNLKDTNEYECISEATFNGSQSFAYFTNSTSLSEINTLIAQFRTRQNNSMILSSVHNGSYFVLSIENGRVKVAYNLAENMSGVVNSDIYLADGNWYELKINSTSSQTGFVISAMEIQQEQFVSKRSFVRESSLLNQSFTSLVASGGVHVGQSSINSSDLIGCLREVRLGKHLLTFTKNATVDPVSGFSAVKSAFMSAQVSNVRIGCHSNTACTSTTCVFGTCADNWNAISCTCLPGHHGDRCDVTPCTSSPCVTGTCAVIKASFECTCADNYVGVYCNETCTENVCENGGECSIADGKVTCTIPLDDESDDNLPLIIGLAVGGGVILLLVIAVIFVCTRQTSSTFGTYSPSGEEKSEARLEMDTVLNVPPPEKLI